MKRMLTLKLCSGQLALVQKMEEYWVRTVGENEVYNKSGNESNASNI